MMKNILKKLNGLLVTASLATMVFSPVALGKQAQANQDQMSKAQLEQIVQQLGLNKSMTFGEFYQKNKQYYPPRVQKMVEQLVTKFKDEPMPQFIVGSTQNSKGETIATLRISGKDQLSNLQFLGEPTKFVKFDNTNISEEDIANFDDMFAKLYFGDASHRKGYGDALTSPKTMKKPSSKTALNKVIPPAKFSGTPKITKELWKKMTPMQRAQFMMNMRMLWSGAQDVLDAKAAGKKGKKTSSLDKWNSFFAMLDEAQAADTKCVVAGYIGNYGPDKKCKYPAGAKVGGCNFPCNPTIYGFASASTPHCLASSSELQTATHFNKGCDAKMPLTKVELPLPMTASAKKDASRYQNILETNKAAALQDPTAMANTKKYLESMLLGSQEMKAAFEKGDITPELLAKLQEIQSQFDSTITAARNDCAAAAAETQYDREFWGACDQLHKRFLFVSAYLDTPPLGCKAPGTKVDPTTLMCACPGSDAVAPGKACGAPVVGPVTDPVGPVSPTVPVDNGGGAAVCDPACSANEECVKGPVVDGVEGDAECKVKPGGGKDDGKPGFFSKLWSGVKKIAPWVIGGVALYAAWKIFFQVKKPKLNPAADACPNGTIPPCGSVCQAPQAMLASGVCGCPACPPGQTMTNASSCLCENTTTTTTLYVCADGVTQVSDLANCPSTANYTCWDGSTVTNPINCPEQPSTGTSTKPVDSSR